MSFRRSSSSFQPGRSESSSAIEYDVSAERQRAADLVRDALDTITVEQLGDPLSEETWQQAFDSFKQAAADENVEAIFRVATLLEAGRFPRLSFAVPAATRCHTVAHAHGGLRRNRSESMMMARGVDRDHFAALQWFTRAAEAGHASAQAMLGCFYEKGTVVPTPFRHYARFDTQEGHTACAARYGRRIQR
jgi:TPR repeat protein